VDLKANLTLAEMQRIFPDVHAPTLQFKYDVIGGNTQMCAWVQNSWLDQQMFRSRWDIE
jgi:hypothetical protein